MSTRMMRRGVEASSGTGGMARVVQAAVGNGFAAHDTNHLCDSRGPQAWPPVTIGMALWP